jgi:4'-phosphopantetheinyl transferase EntD
VALIGSHDRWQSIGVDIESAERWFPGLGDEISTPAERAWLDGVDSERRRRCEIALFSAKEAYYKAVGLPEYLGFDVVEMMPDGEDFRATALRSVGPAFEAGAVHMATIQWDRSVVLATIHVARSLSV